MTDYISPILGDIDEQIYNALIESRGAGFVVLYNRMRQDFNYGVLRVGILYTETEFGVKAKEIKGADLVELLVSRGFIREDAVNVTKVFSVNKRLISDIVELGFYADDVVYGLNLRDRLGVLGLVSSTVTAKYALDDIFTVYPIIAVEEEEEELPPPPELETWHPFLAGVLITCDTWIQAKNRRQVRSIEARGKFEARKDVILPEFIIETAVLKVLQDYVMNIESQGTRSYESFLDECGNLELSPPSGYPQATELLGYDSLEEQLDTFVLFEDEDEKEINVFLELYDVNYKKLRDTRRITLVGKWWEK